MHLALFNVLLEILPIPNSVDLYQCENLFSPYHKFTLSIIAYLIAENFQICLQR